jgi:hypothetical protein
MNELQKLTEQYKAKIVSYKDMLAKKEISESEYKELVQDLLDLGKFQGKLKEEALKVQAAKAVQALSMIAGLA